MASRSDGVAENYLFVVANTESVEAVIFATKQTRNVAALLDETAATRRDSVLPVVRSGIGHLNRLADQETTLLRSEGKCSRCWRFTSAGTEVAGVLIS